MKQFSRFILLTTILTAVILSVAGNAFSQVPVWHTADQQVGYYNDLATPPDPSVTVNKPTNLAVGDMIVITIHTHDNPGTITSPAGFISIGASDYCGETPSHCSVVAAFYKIATAGDLSTTSYTFNTSIEAPDDSQYLKAVACRVTGFNSTTPIGATSGVSDDDLSGAESITIPNITPIATPNNFLLVAGLAVHNNLTDITTPTGMTAEFENTATYGSAMIASQSFSDVTQTGGKTFNWDDSSPSYGAGAFMFMINGPAEEADLLVTKTVSTGPYYFGYNVTFTVTVQNLGPDNATGVAITDLLPTGYTYVSHIASSGTSYANGTGVWTIGSLTNGATATLTITATILTTGIYQNCAEVTAADQSDPVPGNNEACSSITPQQAPADLALTKEIAPPTGPYYFGANVIFTITVQNLGPENATGVVANDLLPAGFSYLSHTSTTGTTYDEVTGIWAIGNLANGASVTLALTATILPAGSWANCGAITASDQFDPNTSNNDECVIIAPTPPPAPLADLGIVKTVEPGPYYFGANVTFTITVHNYGPEPATGVVVTEVIPAGFQYVGHTISQGTCTWPVPNTWSVGALANGATATATLTVLPLDNGGPWENAVSVTGTQEDPNLSNNSFSVSVTPTMPPETPIANWALYLGLGLIITFIVIRFSRVI